MQHCTDKTLQLVQVETVRLSVVMVIVTYNSRHQVMIGYKRQSTHNIIAPRSVHLTDKLHQQLLWAPSYVQPAETVQDATCWGKKTRQLHRPWDLSYENTLLKHAHKIKTESGWEGGGRGRGRGKALPWHHSRLFALDKILWKPGQPPWPECCPHNRRAYMWCLADACPQPPYSCRVHCKVHRCHPEHVPPWDRERKRERGGGGWEMQLISEITSRMKVPTVKIQSEQSSTKVTQDW